MMTSRFRPRAHTPTAKALRYFPLLLLIGCAAAQPPPPAAPVGAPPAEAIAAAPPFATGPISDHQRALYLQGLALSQERRWEQARSALHAALAEGGYTGVAVALGQTYDALGQCHTAIRWYRYALEAPRANLPEHPSLSDQTIISTHIEPALAICPPKPMRMIRLSF